MLITKQQVKEQIIVPSYIMTILALMYTCQSDPSIHMKIKMIKILRILLIKEETPASLRDSKNFIEANWHFI